jgi:hypothetical protein
VIPEDIMKTAENTLDIMLCDDTESCGGADGLRRAAIDIIARALLAERERAARIAFSDSSIYGYSGPPEHLAAYVRGREAAAAAIRNA